MKKPFRVLSAFAFFLTFFSAQAQTSTCSLSASVSGNDDDNATAMIDDFSCIDTVTNSFVTGMTIDVDISGSYCGSWYQAIVEINGTPISGVFCDGTYDLSEHVSNLNSITSVALVSQDAPGDGISDYITLDLDLNIEYLITDCPPPGDLSVTSITSSSALFSWTPNGTEILWDVELVDITAGDTATGTPTTFGVIADSLALTSLNADNMYEIYVRANCVTGTDVESIWIGPMAFETEPTCYPVTDVQISDIIDVAATASWDSDESEWEIELVDITAGGTFVGTPTVLALTDVSYDFSGLAPENDYSFRVRANCGPVDGNSVWSSEVNFTTDPSCLAPVDVELTLLTESSVTVSWTSSDDETLWGIELINIDNGETADLTSDYTSADTSYVIGGLDPNTTYEVFVNAECTTSDFSDWTSGEEFTTLCIPATLPFVDSLNVWPSDCYQMFGANQWIATAGSSGIIDANFSGNTSGWGRFHTGEITVNSQAVLEFDWSSAPENEVNNFVRVLYSINGTDWTLLWTKIGNDLASNDGATYNDYGSFVTTSILLPANTIGQNVVFRFVGRSTTYDNEFFIDEIRVTEVSDCNIAFNVEIDTVTENTATVSFADITTDNSISWDYQVISYSDTVTGNVTTNPFTVTGLTPGIEYTIELSTLCTNDTTEQTFPVSFETECGPLSNYVQEFETYGVDDLPLCWSEIEVNSSIYADLGVSTGFGYNSSNSILFYNSSSNPSSTHMIAITPELSDLSSNWLKFRHRATSTANEKFAIGYLTDIEDETTFVGLDTVTLSLSVWGESVFIPSDYTTFPTDRIAIKALFDDTYGYLYMDDVVWEEIPDCYYPNNVVIDSATINTVYATIDAFNTSDAVWEIELVNLSLGETPTGIPTDTVTTSIFFIDGLAHSSEYVMYVRTDCGSELSPWSDAYNFTTECSAITEFVQNFDVSLSCWTFNNDAVSPYSQNSIVDFTTNSGPNANYFYNSYSSNPNSDHISTVTPELANITAGTHWIKFEARRLYSSGSNLELGTMSDPSDLSSFDLLTTFTLTNSYEEYHYSFVEYTGTDSYIAIRLKIDGTYRYAMIDDVVWEEAPECGTPENVIGVDIQDVTAQVDWNPISIDSVWYMEIVDLATGGAVGVATDSTTSHPYTFTGLTQNTSYAVYVQAGCDTSWSDPYVFTTLISHDIEVSNFVSPQPVQCLLSTEEEVTVTITNNGAQDATGFDVHYSFDGINFTNDGVFGGVLLGGADTAYTLNTIFDFSLAVDTNLFVVVSLVTDTILNDNDTSSTFITNAGDILLQMEVNTGEYAYENEWYVIDTVTGVTATSYTAGGYNDFSTYFHEVCLFSGNTYSIETWDDFGDGWNGGIYTLTQCGGVLVANNNGLSPTIPPNDEGYELESQEYFTLEECDDYDLGIIMMDSIYSSCGMTATEQGYLLVQNFGLMDITSSMNTSIEYQVNGSGWSNLVTFTNFASGADTLLALPTIDMTTPLTYTFEFQVIYALDENEQNDELDLNIESVDTYSEVEQDFDDAPSGWTAHISTGTALSWEWGEPTTTMIGTGADGNAWVTRLDEDMFLNEESYLLSPCFDLSGYANDAEVSFDFIWTSPSSTNIVRFQTSTDGGSTWSNSVLMPINTTEWIERVMLLDLAGESDVKFRFFMDNSYSIDAEGFGMDNFQVFEHVPYTDTTLIDLTVDGTTIPGFDPAVFDYNYEVPYGTSTAPTVDGTVNAPFYESMVVTQSATIPGTATVVVTAEDTNFTATYTVNFTEAPASTNAYLSDLLEDGVTILGFDSAVFNYYDTLAYGTTLVPNVTSTTSDNNATSNQTNPAVLPGAVVIVVTAEDGTTTNTYTINYALADPDTVSALSDLTVDGLTVAGFDPDTLVYTVPVTTFPVLVGYTPESLLSSVSVSPAGPYTGPTTVEITVTAQDGSTTVYTVNLTDPLSSDADLSDLTVGSSTVSGFHPDTLEYTIELPYGDPILPVGYTTSDADATVDVTTSGTTLPGTTTITVTAADGTVKIYVINWTEADASDNNLLANLQVGTGVEGELLHETLPQVVTFDPLVNYYRWVVTDPIYASQITPLTIALAQDPTATVDITHPLTWGTNPYVIEVTAQNGDVNTYYINAVNAVSQAELEAGSVSIYPNPSTGLVNVEVVEDITDYTIEIVSTTGQKVFFREYENGNTQVTLDLSTVADGMYYVILTDAQSGKFTKEKVSIIK